MSQWWSWLLTAVGVFGLYLAGRKSKTGWAVGFGAQALWIAYAVATRQWGFIASALAYGTVYARNWLRWRRESMASAAIPPPKVVPAPTNGRLIDPPPPYTD